MITMIVTLVTSHNDSFVHHHAGNMPILRRGCNADNCEKIAPFVDEDSEHNIWNPGYRDLQSREPNLTPSMLKMGDFRETATVLAVTINAVSRDAEGRRGDQEEELTQWCSTMLCMLVLIGIIL